MANPIHKRTLGYFLFRNHTNLLWNVFFRRISVEGKHNIPKNEATIFAVNHQNTLMDALAVLFAMKGQPVFMARADIFNNKTAAKFLRFIKIIPIFRIRDGIKNLANNDKSFDEAVATLQDRERLVLYPEGSHLGEHRLRSMKKGIARIAFQAEKQNDFKLGLKIVPTGVDYSHYVNFRSNLLINYGKPIEVARYKELYEQNEQKAMTQLMEDVRQAIIPQMLHIDAGSDYEAVEYATRLAYAQAKTNKTVKTHLHKIQLQQKVADKLLEMKERANTEFANITQSALLVKKALKKQNLRPWVLTKERYSIFGIVFNLLMLLVFLPLFVAGTIYNAVPFFLPVYLSKGVKDRQFKSTFRFVIGEVIITILYLIYAVILFTTLNCPILAVIILLSGIPMGLAAFAYYKLFRKTMAKIKANSLRKNTEWQKVRTHFGAIVNLN